MTALPLWAQAGLTAEQALDQFNVVVLGNATSSSHVDGRTFVGGNLSGGDYVQHADQTPASSFAGLTVLGNAKVGSVNGLGIYVGGNLDGGNINSGGTVVAGNVSNANLNGNTAAAVGGTVSSSNVNSGLLTGSANASALSSAGQIANSENFASLFSQTSSFLSGLASTGSYVTIANGTATFNAVVQNGVAVFNLNAIENQVFSQGQFAFNLNGATTVIFNSDSTSVNISANFLNSAATNLASSMIWNFYDATSVTLNSQFGGSILATKAMVTNTGNIEGTVVAQSLNQQAEIHLQPFTGTLPVSPVPEPASYAMMLAGLGLLGLWAKRRTA